MLRPTSKRWLLLAAAILLLAGGSALTWRCRVPTTLLLVRHADRAANEDALTPAGLARASELARVAAKLAPAAIYHSNTQRARDTAGPLARALGLSPLERPAADVDGLLAEILEQRRGQRVLVVGHSNTVPQLIRAAGGPSLPDLEHDEFDDLFVLSVCSCWPRRAEVTHLQYGAASP
ncbi:MAG TPA: phosphoglycerate mutase family protein [Polyangiaceae bacterium]|nr:phosphoglycerate mutase family protein [Polyangiaceae bacterium]